MPISSVHWFHLAAIALVSLWITPPARSADAFRLDRVAVTRFTDLGNGKLRKQTGVLFASGEIQWRAAFELSKPENTPDWGLDRNLIPAASWAAYYSLGADSMRNFALEENAVSFLLGNERFHFVGPNPDAQLATGQVMNIATRARLGAGEDVVVGGFVIEERRRRVLVRAVGPSLAKLGVSNPARDPRLVLLDMRSGERIHANDNWQEQPDAGAIRTLAARVGAFPLEERSTDAALSVELPPGVYSALVESTDPAAVPGIVLLEIYSVSS